jgi:hypothetical protein
LINDLFDRRKKEDDQVEKKCAHPKTVVAKRRQIESIAVLNARPRKKQRILIANAATPVAKAASPAS